MKRFFLSRLYILDDQFRPVPQKSYPFPVRRYDRLKTGLPRIRHRLFLHFHGISEILVVFLRQRSRIYAPVTVSLGRIIKGPAIFRETQVALLLGCIRDSFGRIVVYGSHEHIAPENYRDFLSVRRNSQVLHSARQIPHDIVFFEFVRHYSDFHFFRFAALPHRIEFAIVGKGQGAVPGNGNVSYRVHGAMRYLDLFGRVGNGTFENIETSALLAEVIKGIPVCSKYGIPVLALECRQLLESPLAVYSETGLAFRRSVKPDIACH